MHLYIDSADSSDLGTLPVHPVFWGVTTNPTLQRAAHVDEEALEDLVRHLLAAGVKAVHVQVKTRDVDGIVEQGLAYASWGEKDRIFVKVPATRSGFEAVRRLALQGVACTITAAFEVEQVLFAKACGARYVAPYLGRMNDAGVDGLARIARMHAVLERYQAPSEPACRLLVASVRTMDDLRSLLDIGVGAATIKPDLARQMLENEATLSSEDAFLADAAAGERGE
ncbi:MAG: transaldolase family protein [Deinococcales bacterium]|jgi:transaldolase